MNTSSNGHTSSRPPDSLAQPRLAPLFAHELLRLVNVREGGRTIRLPAIRAIARRQIAQAIDGKSCDLSGLIKTAQMIEREREKEKPAKSDSKRQRVAMTLRAAKLLVDSGQKNGEVQPPSVNNDATSEADESALMMIAREMIRSVSFRESGVTIMLPAFQVLLRRRSARVMAGSALGIKALSDLVEKLDAGLQTAQTPTERKDLSDRELARRIAFMINDAFGVLGKEMPMHESFVDLCTQFIPLAEEYLASTTE